MLAEVRATREALPGLLDRANQAIDKATTIGQKAGEGAVKGVIGGIVSAPFRLIGGVGKSFTDMIGLGNRKDFTREDERLAGDTTETVLKNGQVGAESSWHNPDSKNRGGVTLTEKWARGRQPCVTLRHRVELRGAPLHQQDVNLCQQPDGSWQETTR